MLKQLELHGFKSFADKTAFDFSTGITGVVGPNGSGKSNVVDSIKWILGDQSASSLRGKSMSDVIFNGAAGRSGSPFAEATLTFCNESGFLPTEMKEVRVGRRLWRSGDSEYLINGEVTRLKDVRNLFMGTGAGASSYCIIEQGRVGQILQTNASSRRSVFEEAAGISRYQSRRAEALRKLDRVEQHIARLSDIVEESDSRLNAVRNQAAKAAKYREIHTEFKALWVGLAADEYRRVSKRQQSLAEEIEDLNASIEAITTEQEGIEAERTEAEAALTAVEEKLKVRERKRNELQSQIASLRTTVRHEHSRLEETEQELETLRTQRSLLKSRTNEAANELQRTQKVLDNEQQSVAELREKMESAEQRYRDFEAEIVASTESLESDRNGLMEQMQKNSALELQLTTTQKNRESADQQIEKLTADYDELVRLLSACEERFAAQESSVNELEAELTAADENIQSIRQQREALLTQQASFQSELTKLREDRTNHEARAAVLEDLERKYEGLRIGTREVLKRAKSDPCEPWSSIVGGVNELLDVDLDKAALLEVALSDRAQLIVVREMDLFIEHINNGRCQLEGRVGFVSLTDIRNSQFFSSPWRPADAELPDLSSEHGIVCAAADLARCSEETPRLATHLLGDTWIVETLNDAIYLSDKTQRKCRFVTLQGELVESDGTLFAGIELSSSSVLTRRSELRRLGEDIRSIGTEIESKEQDGSRVAAELVEVGSRLEAALNETRARSDSLTQLRADLSQVTSERDRLRTQREDLTSKREELAQQNGLFDAALVETQQLMEAGLGLVEELKQRLSTAEHTLITSRQQLESLTTERNQAEIALGKQEERFNALRESLQRLETDVQQRTLQEEEADRRAETGIQRRQEATFRILAATNELAELHLGSEQILATIRTESRELKTLKTNRASVAARESELATQRRELATRLHEVEMEQGTLNHQLETTAARIEDEFQFPLLDAVESGVSAMAAHVIPPLVEHEEVQATENVEEETGAGDTDVQDEYEDDGGFVEPGDVEAERARDAEDDAAGEHGEWDEDPEREGGEDFDDELDGEDDEELRAEEELTPEQSEADESAESDDNQGQIDEQEPGDEDKAPKLSAVEQLEDEEFEELRAELEERVERLRRRLRNMGNVSTESLENLEELESRFGGLSYQLKDLIHARDTLEAIVRRINAESKRLFAETFECIRGHFQDLFRKLFGGGEGDVILEDPDDVLECGIDIVARPPGKELRSISLLSGGEKTMTAVALLLAIFRSRPSPFCILDEVDAALDEANVDRFVQVLREFQETTQFIMITHRKPSMSVCDLIFGVTMQESGVSKRLTVRFEDVNDNGDFIVPDDKQKVA